MHGPKYLILMSAVLLGGIILIANSTQSSSDQPNAFLPKVKNSSEIPSLNLQAQRERGILSSDNTAENVSETFTEVDVVEPVQEEHLPDNIIPPAPRIDPPDEPKPETQDLIQLALLLDCSGSMQGLITQAQAYLWNIVNELAAMQRDQRPARLELALYAYGLEHGKLSGNTLSNQAPSQPGSPTASTRSARRQAILDRVGGGGNEYMQQISGFTTDLEDLADKLFALTTSGSEEYCGTVIARSLQNLEWNMNPETLRLIVIAGNETFDQGPFDYREVCTQAAADGAFINTVFCGVCEQGIQLHWRDAALRGGGSYNCINHDDAIQDVATPYDAELEVLNQELNDTYMAYSPAGAGKKMQQLTNDENTRRLSGEQALNRAMVKSSRAYDNSSWDLVDAVTNDKLELSAQKPEQLPDTLKNMSAAQRQAFVDTLSSKRAAAQQAIRDLGEQRRSYLSSVRAESAQESNNLSDALLNSLRAQAAERGYNRK